MIERLARGEQLFAEHALKAKAAEEERQKVEARLKVIEDLRLRVAGKWSVVSVLSVGLWSLTSSAVGAWLLYVFERKKP